jgi:excisionase family DNA binding protein
MSENGTNGGPGELLTFDEVVSMLKVPRGWLYDRTRKGEIPHLKLGRYLRFDRGQLVAWLAEKVK